MKKKEAEELKNRAQIMRDIYAKMATRGEALHEGQIRLAKDIFVDNKRVVQAQWGRKAGKTLTACYIAWTYALLNPGSQVWIICPQRKQGKDIYWVSGRIQAFGPEKYVTQFKESEITVQLKNESIIRVDGCENFNALRGINPSLVIYDEFQDHSKEFHVEVMAPNLIAKKAALVVIGTPPRRETYYVEFRKQLLHEIAEGDTTRAYYEFPTNINPSIDRVELEKIRERLYRSGDEKIWLREHMAQLVFGGEGAVFTPWDRDRHVKDYDVLMSAIEPEKKHMRWFSVLDPGSSAAFAVLFAAYNPYTSQIYLLDEIYETNPRNTDCKSIWERLIKKEQELCPHVQFKRVYDEAAEWFRINASKMYQDTRLTPCVKNKQHGYSSKEADCSLIKQLMAEADTFFVSSKCPKFVWECENYVLNEKGEYPQDHDHLLDCLNYLLKACAYRFSEDAKPSVTSESIKIMTPDGTTTMRDKVPGEDAMDNVLNDSLFIEGEYGDYFSY